MADSTRQLRNLFYLGLYKQAIAEAESVLKSEPHNTQAKTFYYRSMVFVNPQEIFSKVTNLAPSSHQAVKLLGTYYAASDEGKDMVFDTLKEWLSADGLVDPTLQVVASQIYMEEQNYKEALRLVCQPGDNLEKMAMCVQIYLKINRLDLAQKMAKSMADADDDDPLTQLCLAWTQISEGGEKVGEAISLLQDLIEKYGPSIPVLNGLAICQVQQANHAAAFQLLKQAKDAASAAGVKTSPETYINTIVVLQSLKKSPDIIRKISGEFEKSWPENAWLKKMALAEAAFAQHAAAFSWKKE
jgi:coatomer subunit epsilon